MRLVVEMSRFSRPVALGMLVAFVVCARLGAVHADDATLTADAIAAKVIHGDTFSFEGSSSKVRMLLIEVGGDKQERAMEIVSRLNQGLSQTLVRFSSPQDIAGTAFLVLARGKAPSEQYVYLPGLKRTRRIAGREREGSFMGSDFSYADMQPVDPHDAKHKRLPDEMLGNEPVFVLESTLNADAPVPYGKVMTWIRKKDYVALRTRFYDRAGKLQKTLYTRRVREVNGKPVVVEARMQNQNNHITDLYIDAIDKRDGLSDANFTPAALEHL